MRLKGIPYPEILPNGVELPIAGEVIRKGDPVLVLKQWVSSDEMDWRVVGAPAEMGKMHGVALEDAQPGEPLRIQAFVIGRAMSATTMCFEPVRMDEQHLLVLVKE